MVADNIFVPDIREFDKIVAKKDNKELGISFKVVRRENSTDDKLAKEILDGTKLRVGAWEKNFNADKIKLGVKPVTVHRKTDDFV